MSASNVMYPGNKLVTFPTASCSITIGELARNHGAVLTSIQLDALDRALDDTKEASK